uniref:Carboxylesterase type B domain-containing protein n=1 Tax=Timema douglasi TaxID=61478 RepID=A0A7R8VN19_TIMDO|nr:unnamed protein product [Timema douglasi]
MRDNIQYNALTTHRLVHLKDYFFHYFCNFPLGDEKLHKHKMGLKNQIVATAWALEILILLRNSLCQEPRVQLNQGVAVGIKIYADSREPIHVYLGIPYSAPRIGESRFSPPEPPPPWNRTFYANKFAPSCVQLTDPASKTPFPQDEDCLYLNIYVPEKNINRRETSVLVFIEGGGFVSGSVNNFPAQELAAEGVIVVSINYRLNVFGFFCLNDIYARGNLGLLDQYFALLWVKDNIESFGGNKSSITLMGHSAGAASVIYHMISPRTSGYFQRAIVMSGSVLSPWSRVEDPSKCSRAIARSLGCLAETSRTILQCLRSKSVEELLHSFLPEAEQYLPRDPEEVLKTGQYGPIPVLMGTTSYEGVVTLYQWRDLIRQSYQELRSFFENSAIPNILEHYDFIKRNSEGIREIIKWQYVNQVQEGDTNGMSNRAIKHLVLERGPLNTSVGRPSTSSCRYHGSGWQRLHFNKALFHFERKMGVQRPNQYTEHGQLYTVHGLRMGITFAKHQETFGRQPSSKDKQAGRHGAKSKSVIPGTQAPEKLAPALPCRPALDYLRKKTSTGTGWREDLAPPSDHPITRKSGAQPPNSHLLRPSLICPRTIIETNCPEFPSGDLKENSQENRPKYDDSNQMQQSFVQHTTPKFQVQSSQRPRGLVSHENSQWLEEQIDRVRQCSVHNSGSSELDHMALCLFILVFSSNLNDEQCSVLMCVKDPYKVLVSQ